MYDETKIIRKFSQNTEIKNLTPSIDGEYPLGSLWEVLSRSDADGAFASFFKKTRPSTTRRLAAFGDQFLVQNIYMEIMKIK